MLHKLALGIMAQPGAYKHTYKIMLPGWLSRMMSGRPSVRMPRCLSMMISRCLSMMKSESPSMMVFEGQSIRMFQCLSVMMSGGPSMRMFGRLSVMMSESSSVMMFRWFTVMMSGGPIMRMIGPLSMMMSESPSMMMFGSLSMMKSESPSMMVSGGQSMRMFQRLSVMVSGGPSMRMFGHLSMMMSESSSVMMFRWLAVMMSESPSMMMFGSLSMMKSESPSVMVSGGPSMRVFGHLSVMMSESPSVMMFKWLAMMMSGGPLMRMIGPLSMMMSESPSMMMMLGCLLIKFFGRSSKKISEEYTGLVNQGSTCYLNTVLQILFMTEEFRKAVERYYPRNCNSNLNNHIAQLFKCLKSGERTTATTEGITSALKISVHKQEDAAKCLQKILNKVDPKISKIFQGTKVDKTICKTPAKPHEPLTQVKTFFIISISLESQDRVNMQSCFESYFAPIIMSGEDQQIYCQDCEMMMDTEIICRLRSVPSVLVLHLERFELDFDTMCCVKNESTVEIHPQLLVKDEDGVNHRYDLYAIANHVGSLNGGHYYADIRSFEDQQWYQFNDSSVQKMRNLKCDLDKPLLSDEAYLLLYKKL